MVRGFRRRESSQTSGQEKKIGLGKELNFDGGSLATHGVGGEGAS